MEEPKQLTEREQLILQAVVHTYITTAEPVGSRTIVKRFNLDLSPATVRNVMADLEDDGFLEQRHTSSGRIPTDRGYRYYVDYLMRVQELTLAERHRIEQEMARQLNDVDEVMRQTSHLLALVSNQAGLVETPSGKQAWVRSIELLAISPMRIAILIVDSHGRVSTEMVTVDEEYSPARLQQLRNFLNEHLKNVCIDLIKDELKRKVSVLQEESRQLGISALKILNLMPSDRPVQLFYDGASHLIEQPEFHDVETAQKVFSLFEERDRLVQLLRESVRSRGDRSISIIVGREASGLGLDGLSVIAAPYHVNKEPVGILGILGPKRMPYSRVTALVDCTANILSRFLTRLAGR